MGHSQPSNTFQVEEEKEVRGRWVSLFVLTLVYVVGELSHYLLGIVSRPMSQDIGYGYKMCLRNPDFPEEHPQEVQCRDANNSESCVTLGTVAGFNESACEWNYSGLGLEYQILAGPAFVAVFTVSGIITGMIADRCIRRLVLWVCLCLLVLCTTLMGVATSYWHLVLLRMGIGAGESAFTPACSSMISDLFRPSQRGLAMGIFKWGVYFGYGLSYAVGNLVTEADIAGKGWRMSFFVCGALGAIVCVLLLFVPEPEKRSEDPKDRQDSKETSKSNVVLKSYDAIPNDVIDTSRVQHIIHSGSPTRGEREEGKLSFWSNLISGKSGLKQVFRVMLTPPVIMLTLAASIRHTAGFTWGYNTQLYFSTYYPSYNLGIWITAVSIIGGTLGVASGGFVSDKLVKKLGLTARIYVLAASQLVATPFAVGVLSFSPPLAFYILIVSYLFAEMWFGVVFAVLLELVPSEIHSTSIAIFLFVINNVGGNTPILIEPLSEALSYHHALIIMYPGFYLASSVLFFLTSFSVSKMVNERKEVKTDLQGVENVNENAQD